MKKSGEKPDLQSKDCNPRGRTVDGESRLEALPACPEDQCSQRSTAPSVYREENTDPDPDHPKDLLCHLERRERPV